MEAFQPRPNAKRLVLRPKTNNLNELNDKISIAENCSLSINEITSQLLNKENEIRRDDKLTVLNDRRSSNSWLKSSIPRKSKTAIEEYINQPTVLSEVSKLPVISQELENTITELRSSPVLDNREISDINISDSKHYLECSMNRNQLSCELDDRSITELQPNEATSNKANIKLNRYGYYTIPTLESLDSFVKSSTCIVPNFTVGRNGYGNVYFPDSFDVYGLNLDEIGKA